MITLHAFGRAFGLPDPSPFVTKVELLLKWADLPYQTTRKGFMKAPKGKLPYIVDQGQTIADSTFIRWHIEKTRGIDFDAGLNETERATAWAVEKLLEDHLYWPMLYYRWCDDANFAIVAERFFGRVPWPMRGWVKQSVRKKMRNYLHAQGSGRHSEAEKIQLAEKALGAIAVLLGDKPYLMGERRCGTDATLAAFLINLYCPLFASPIRDIAARHANLVAYAARMREENFPELATG